MALLVTGCGFHLRGMNDIPKWLNHVALVIQDASRDLEPLLTEQLQAYHINVSSDPALAQYWLVIEHDETRQEIVSISSTTTPRQYQLIYTVRFKFQRTKGPEIIPSSAIVVTRQVTINSDRMLGSTSEEELLKREMRRDAVIQIIGRLSRAHDR